MYSSAPKSCLEALTETQLAIEVGIVKSFLCQKKTSTTEIHWERGGCIRSESKFTKQAWFLCTEFDKGRTDFHLFGSLKKLLRVQHFGTNDEVQQAVLMLLHKLDTDFFHAGFDTLVYRWNKCFDNRGEIICTSALLCCVSL